MGCLDVLSSVAGCVSLPLSKADHIVQQCLCLSMIYGLFSLFFHFGMKILIKVECFPFFSSYPTFLPLGHVVPDCLWNVSMTKIFFFFTESALWPFRSSSRNVRFLSLFLIFFRPGISEGDERVHILQSWWSRKDI